ncbi:MAG: NAD+ synthase [Bacteroidetes bacterium GWE2_41_25]|nr:MAG: NAD+ synthase [Bacteroidetes bacterium GWA2_40_15]OFX91135.1 MAG: NAD+ synthase [Bacteroidetes bacterium GWE2_41_25]OFX95326.1 MAG: NAD+ synthase [Bacteroidetes bacterium GWC2_40_22]OFY61324.1 MAG: NAD+ synthase [Bacteroidetes bacterium GWF2_41_9]HAM10067.1 NAD+ synthase [Bacteroidales bacterium]
MRISVSQLNYHIGNFDLNKSLICKAITKAREAGSELVIFSELCISGYPPLDLLDRYDFIEKCNQTVNEIAAECHGIKAIIGSPTINPKPEGKKLYNSALVLSEGEIIFTARKALLPTYDIFDEYRYFEPEKRFSVFSLDGLKLALTICEDLWDEQPFDNKFEKTRLYTVSPMEELVKQNPDLIINIAASPFSYTKTEARENIFRDKARKYGLPVISVNQTGANTELIFDGASVIVDHRGGIYKKLPYFEERIETFETDHIISGSGSSKVEKPEEIELIHKALVTGISDYFSKSGLRTAILGLSGGIDSAVCLCLAKEALGNKNIRSLLMPSRYSSEHSVNDAVELSDRLNTKYDIVNIEKPFQAFEEDLAPLFKGHEKDVTEENIQARVRAVILMAVSNKFGSILLNTSNKSEAAVGYGTLYGDMAGGLSVIGDVYKTDIYRLAEYINRENEIIPVNIIKKLPSAELKPDQLDSDSLPEYSILDNILYNYIELQKPAEQIIEEGADRETVYKVIRMINYNEYKRYQAPPILRISSKAFGAGRRMPLVARY